MVEHNPKMPCAAAALLVNHSGRDWRDGLPRITPPTSRLAPPTSTDGPEPVMLGPPNSRRLDHPITVSLEDLIPQDHSRPPPDVLGLTERAGY